MDEDLEDAVCDLKAALYGALDATPNCRAVLRALAELLIEYSPDDIFAEAIFTETLSDADAGCLTVH